MAARFEAKCVLITGAASGIGRATAVAFAREGARVAILDKVGTSENAAPLGSCISIQVDLACPGDVTLAVQRAAETLGKLDSVINCAGVACATRIDDLILEEWNRVLAVNLTAPYLVCRAALPWLRKQQAATIVNVASATALLPSALAGTAYAASKGGVLVFTKALAAELAPHIRVNAVCPGLVDTPLMAHVLHGQSGPPAHMLEAYSLGRAATPEEIASAILYLASTESSFVNGIAFAVDGGRTFH
jgi:NAD(P)-dependent dehydrogenase (short-subunit alcohol dehydrogenase family)